MNNDKSAPAVAQSLPSPGLNLRTIRNAKPGDVVWDDEVKGLHLRCRARSSKFYLSYRIGDQQRRHRIGDAAVYTLEQARKEAREILRHRDAGTDPKLVKAAVTATQITVDKVAERYFAEYAANKSDKGERDRELYEGYASPAQIEIAPGTKVRFGSMFIRDVKYDHVSALHKGLAHIPVRANRVKSMLSKLFNLCEAPWAYRDLNTNPCLHVTRHKEVARVRYASPAELAKIAKGLRDWWHRSPESVIYILVVIMSGARPGEPATWRWSRLAGNTVMFDFKRKVNRTVTLPKAALALLERLPRREGDDSMFSIANPRRVWNEIKAKAGIKNLHMHDLRHTFVTAGAAQGVPLTTIGGIVGHSDVATTQIYQHLHAETAQPEVEKISGAVVSMMGGLPALPAPK